MTSLEFLTIGVILITGIIILFIILIYIQKQHHKNSKGKIYKAQNQIDKIYHNDYSETKIPASEFSLRQFMALQDQIILDETEKKAVIEQLQLQKLYKKLKRNSKSLIPQKRLKAYYKLKFIPSEDLRIFLLKRLRKEKRENIQFIIVYALLDVMDEEVFADIMSTIQNSSLDYQYRISTILNNHYNVISNYTESYLNSDVMSVRLCMLKMSLKNGNQYYSEYIMNNIESFIIEYFDNKKEDPVLLDIIETSMQYLLVYHSIFLISNKLFSLYDNFEIVKYIVDGYAKECTVESLNQLLKLYERVEYNEYYSLALSKMIKEEQKLLLHLIDQYDKLKDPNVHKYIAKVLTNKMEYILLKLQDENTKNYHNIIVDLLQDGYNSSIIEFLNENNIVSLEDTILNLIKPTIQNSESIRDDFRLYADDKILVKLNITRMKPLKQQKDAHKQEKSKIIWILSVVAFTVLILPLIFVFRRYSIFGIEPWKVILTQFVVDANFYLIFYFLFANGIYIYLIILSFYGARKQLSLWDIKTSTLLFEENLLPSISVLAPAYNEEMNIIESVSSLLNLTYPNYEIIVINDGSSDKTLQKVITHYQLKRKNYLVNYDLKTKQIRGIYTNVEYPNLIVVDKYNGGKADALNVGINISSKQYICGIDSDSVLDADSLLRLSAVSLDEKHPILAFGGNIIPSNGCVINRGKVEKRGFADKFIPRLQSLEYLRAFTTGRIGWSQMNSLLIISGAFGLFERENIVKIGGYITSSGIMKKDSVGEDMELVVRLTHNAIQSKKKYYVKYIFHANCYTELPSDLKTLFRQRNRWHRGLVDILSYYRKLFFNPKYKQIGLLAIPYFYFFEVIGPLLEVIGYSMLILGLILGILNPLIIFGIFFASVWLGIIISLSSLYVSELDESSFSKKEILLVIIFAVIENFGYRQILSFHRAYSLFTALKESGKWGEQKRKGVNTK